MPNGSCPIPINCEAYSEVEGLIPIDGEIILTIFHSEARSAHVSLYISLFRLGLVKYAIFISLMFMSGNLIGTFTS